MDGSPHKASLLDEKDQEELLRTGLTQEEYVDAKRFFIRRLQLSGKTEVENLDIEDVDLVLRQLRVFSSIRFLHALFKEIDEDNNGTIEIHEFVMMVAKLRGKQAFSSEFYLRSLPRTMVHRIKKIFEILSASEAWHNDVLHDDGLLDEEAVTTGTRQMNPSSNVESDEFKRHLNDLGEANEKSRRYSLTDFLILQARFRKPPPEVDAALLSLTEEELARYTQVFQTWRAKGNNAATAGELKNMFGRLGFPTSVDKIRRLLAEVECDSLRNLQALHFLYFLVSHGAGTSTKTRRILRPSASYAEAFKSGISLRDLYELGFEDLGQIQKAGWSPHAVWNAGLGEPFELRRAGYTAADLRKLGISAKDLKLAGYSLQDLMSAGFSEAAVFDCCSTLSSHSASRPNTSQGLTLQHGAGVGTEDRHGELRWWSTPRVKTMLDDKRPASSPHRRRGSAALPLSCLL